MPIVEPGEPAVPIVEPVEPSGLIAESTELITLPIVEPA